MPTLPPAELDVSPALLDAIRSFPTVREVEHCGKTFSASPLAIYADCPACGRAIKLRSFSAGPELADVFDAVLEWLNQPAGPARDRQRELTADDE